MVPTGAETGAGVATTAANFTKPDRNKSGSRSYVALDPAVLAHVLPCTLRGAPRARLGRAPGFERVRFSSGFDSLN